MNVYLEDVNDNAPYLNITRPLIVWENVEPPQFVGPVTAYDPDGPGNGPPFKFRYVTPVAGLDVTPWSGKIILNLIRFAKQRRR